METTTALILKINDLERKLEKMQEIVDTFNRSRCDSDDTENLIAEEVHWCSVNFFVMHNTWITHI